MINIVADSHSEEEKSIASLTALERTEWARIRKQHFMSGVNHESMNFIDKAILVVSLTGILVRWK